MSNCKYETKNGRCSLKDSYAYRHKCYTEESCKCHEAIEPCGRREPMTNADRIRAMTDEELAEWIARTQIGAIKDAMTILRLPYDEGDKIVELGKTEALEWLQQPAEGDA